MSRKSDIEQAYEIYFAPGGDLKPALDAAYDLGRAAQAEKYARELKPYELPLFSEDAKRLRAKVRKQGERK